MNRTKISCDDHLERYVEAARAAGDSVVLTLLPGQDHFSFLQPGEDAWTASLDAVLGSDRRRQ